MVDWISGELALLRSVWPDLEYVGEGHWVLLADYVLPDGWDRKEADLAVRIPASLPGQEPYAFWIRSGLTLASGATPSNYSFPSETLPFPGDNQWGQFSWSVDGGWAPGSAPGEGTGMVQFVYSVAQRLRELN